MTAKDENIIDRFVDQVFAHCLNCRCAEDDDHALIWVWEASAEEQLEAFVVAEAKRLQPPDITVLTKAITDELQSLAIALEESVKLQSHYALLLNAHDGGQRRAFKDALHWTHRLRETGTLPPRSYPPTTP